MKAKKLLSLGIAAVIGASLLASCGGNNAATTTDKADTAAGGGTYAFVAKDVQNPYMQKAI